jgi:hypothetical protein
VWRRRGRAGRSRAPGPAHLVEQLGEAEVEELDLAVVGEHRVGELDVAVQHAHAVRGRQAARQADAQLQHLAPRKRHRELAEALAADVLGDQEGMPLELADAVDHHHVRVLDASHRPRLDEEAVAVLGVRRHVADELHRDRTVEHVVVREIDAAHAAATEQTDQPVLVEALRRHPVAGLGLRLRARPAALEPAALEPAALLLLVRPPARRVALRPAAVGDAHARRGRMSDR